MPALALGAWLLVGQAAGKPASIPTLQHACHQKVAARALYIRTSDGLTLYGAVLGTGNVGVVLAPQHFGTSCEWVPEAKLLAARGYRVFVFDYRSAGYSQAAPTFARAARIDLDVLAAARELRRLGSTRIVFVGSLIGSIAALDAAAVLHPAVTALVAIAPPDVVEPGALTLTAAARAIQAPVLVLAGNIAGVSRSSARRFYDKLASHEKHLLRVPATAQGADVLKDKTVNAAVLQFIATHGR